MKIPELPEDEVVRLQALHSLGILDTQSEERFDRLTRMARRLFDVPIAVVSLVDHNRQWFKSCSGLEVSETTRDVSFCGHAILDDAIFVVPDALCDPRFHDNPLVISPPFIRFYAGCPLRLKDGERVGTLCILDSKPRTMSQDDLKLLSDLTLMVIDELSASKVATVDMLTQVSTRFGFEQLAQVSLRFCAQYQIPLCLCFFDLDKFKEINDQHGHAIGDQALRSFAIAMKASFRSTDLLARLGGDEFVALLIGADAERAGIAIEHLSSILDRQNRNPLQAYQLVFSHGVVEFDLQQHHSIHDLLEQSDKRMYQHKSRQLV